MAADLPNLIGDGITFLGISGVLAVVGIACFGARTYTSWRCTKRFLLDYWLSLLTFTLCVLSQIFFAFSVTFGLGFHVRDLSHPDVVAALHTSWVSQLTGIVASVSGKLSIIAFLDQIRGRHQGRPWFLYFVGASTVVVNVIVVVLILVQCTPLDKLWDETVPGNCNLRSVNNSYAYFQGGYSALSDAVLALYPIHLIKPLKVSKRMKIGLSFLLGFGLLATAITIVKTVQLVNLSHHDEHLDVTFFVARLALATLAEAWIVMAVGCVPTLRPLMRAVMRRVRGTGGRTGPTTPYYELDDHGMPVRGSTGGKSGVERKRFVVERLGSHHGSVVARGEVYGVDGTRVEKGVEGRGGNGIVVVTELNVSYDGRRGRSGEDENKRFTNRQVKGFLPV